MSEEYSLRSPFDLEKHKATFVDYLEIIIGSNGIVAYAVPSHQEFLIKVACAKMGWTREQMNEACPPEYYFDFIKWLCIVSGAMAVWTYKCEYGEPTVKQISMLRKLKMAGLYKGAIPKTSEKVGEK